MGFTQPCVSDKDKVEGIFDPGRVDEGQDVVLADLGIEMPVELVQSLDMSYARHTQKSFDLILSSVIDLDLKEVQDRVTPVGGYLIGRCFAAQFLQQGFKIIHRTPPILWVYRRYSKAHPSEAGPFRLR
jgi:hypothetical protein